MCLSIQFCFFCFCFFCFFCFCCSTLADDLSRALLHQTRLVSQLIHNFVATILELTRYHTNTSRLALLCELSRLVGLSPSWPHELRVHEASIGCKRQFIEAAHTKVIEFMSSTLSVLNCGLKLCHRQLLIWLVDCFQYQQTNLMIYWPIKLQ